MDPKPTKGLPVSGRMLLILLAVVGGIALVGFIVGTRPVKAPEPRHPSPPANGNATAAPARDYGQLGRARRRAGRSPEVTRLLGSAPQEQWQGKATQAEWQAALDARAKRRPYDGAPPVIPHGVDTQSTGSCLVCHGKGATVGGLIAAPIPHPAYANCLQCHVRARPDARPSIPVGNAFVGAGPPGKGFRAFVGAPPTIPHPLWMRDNCLSCHGPAGKWTLRSSHAQRTNCQQCHVADTRRLVSGLAR